LAKEGAQRLGKIQALLGVDVDLVDAFQVDLDGVFSRGNVPFHGVENIKAGIKRNRLTRAGRAGHQNHALGLVQSLQVHLLLVILIAQGIDAHLGAVRVQNTQHDLLTPQGGQGVDPEVDGLVLRDLQLDPPVLRLASLGQVHGRHDLKACSELGTELNRRFGNLVQNAIRTKAYAVHLFIGLEVQV